MYIGLGKEKKRKTPNSNTNPPDLDLWLTRKPPKTKRKTKPLSTTKILLSSQD